MPDLRAAASWRRVSRWMIVGVLATTLAACGGSSGGSSAGGSSSGGSSSNGSSVLTGDPAVIVAGSAQRTADAKNAKVDLTGTVSTGGATQNLNGTGAIDFAGKTFTLNITVPGMGAIEERFVDDVIYIKIPEQEASQFGGKPWLKIDPKAFGSGSNGQNPFGSLDSSNPSELLNTLQGAGNVTKVGEEDVRGVKTTHFRADIDVAKAAEKQGLTPEQKAQLQQTLGGKTTVPEDVWLDDQGLVRRLAVAISATAPSAAASTSPSTPTSVDTKFTMEFYDYGQATQPVTAPPVDQVTDFGQILGQLGQLSSSSGSTTG